MKTGEGSSDRLRQLEQKLAQHEETITAQHVKFDAFVESSIDAIVQMNFEGRISGWNRQAEKIFGWRADEAIGRKLEKTIIPERYRQAHEDGMHKFLQCGQGSVINTLFEIHALHRDGHEFPVELSVALVDVPGLQEFNAYIRDISERKQAESIIWNQANFDSLTSLPNRNLFLHRLEQEILNCRRNGLSLGLLFIDLDRFKEVNDLLGHDMGDLMLVEISSRLKNSVREVDIVSRLSGDEFTIILGNIDDQLSVQRVCQSLLDALARPYRLDDEVVYLTASIGATFYPDDADNADSLQKNADQAMYAAKTRGRNRYHFFTRELHEQALRKRNITNDLRLAMGNRQFEVYYQPIIDMQSGNLIKAEALLRWHHPVNGMISPSVFIPLAEEAGMIIDIGDWVFQRACEVASHWRDRFNADFQISINTSPLQWIDDESTMMKWFEQLQQLGLDGGAIGVEITEGLLMHAGDLIINRLLEFRDARVQVSIDDFGTGYSSLSYLKQFDIDYLKIDQSFVRNLGSDQNDLALCEAIIVMAHKLGIRVIAEGVETRQQQLVLQESGCDFAQGFLFSRPLPVQDFEALFEQGSFLQ